MIFTPNLHKGCVHWHCNINVHNPYENTWDGLKNIDKPYTQCRSWRPYAERGGWKNGCNAVVCVWLHLKSRSRKALISSAAPYTFNSFFFEKETVWYSRYMIWQRTALKQLIVHVFITSGQTKFKTSLGARGPLVFRGPYAACVFCV